MQYRIRTDFTVETPSMLLNDNVIITVYILKGNPNSQSGAPIKILDNPQATHSSTTLQLTFCAHQPPVSPVNGFFSKAGEVVSEEAG